MAKRAPTRKATVSFTGETRMVALVGPERAKVRDHLSAIKAALTQAHGEIEAFRFDGKSAELADVFDELRGYSLMSTYKLVLVEDAEKFVKDHRAALERYAESPVDHATLVLISEAWNRGNLDKQIAKLGGVIKCDPAKPAEAITWLIGRAEHQHQAELPRASAARMVERMGTALDALDSELGKLAVMAGPGKPITPALIDEATGQHSDEKAWAVQAVLLDALTSGRPGGAVEQVRELIDLAGHPVVLVNFAVADLMRKLAVAKGMQAARQPDAAIMKAAKVWGPQVLPFKKALQHLGPDRARALLSQALHMDARGKSGLGDPVRNLECFCVTMTDNKLVAR